MSPDSIPAIPITDSAEFMLLYQSAQESMKQYLSMVATTIGFVILGIGWLTTSKEARNLVSQRRGYWIGTGVAIAMCVLHTGISFWWRGHLMEKVRLLSSVRNHGWLPHHDFVLDFRSLALNLGLVWTLYLTALALLHAIYVAAERERAAAAASPASSPPPAPAPLAAAEPAQAIAGAAAVPVPAISPATLPADAKKPPRRRR